ncbi:hypothetical protein OKW33_006185 [Paraburkholderia atlantica]|uniref:Flavodoxin-like domain-containing protein n=1 Tax=Paraburkholderia atlantica TaxID=2654982 RepID=A0A7W8QEV4_PARAM|nr:hypothetical protein [Paraburkholderia atlantica]
MMRYKILVVFYSRSGPTRKIASVLARMVGADVRPIRPLPCPSSSIKAEVPKCARMDEKSDERICERARFSTVRYGRCTSWTALSIVFAGKHAVWGLRPLSVDARHTPVPGHRVASALRAPLKPANFAFDRIIRVVQIEPFEHTHGYHAVPSAYKCIAAIDLQRTRFGQFESEVAFARPLPSDPVEPQNCESHRVDSIERIEMNGKPHESSPAQSNSWW